MRAAAVTRVGSPSAAAARGGARVLSVGLAGLGLLFLSRPTAAAQLFGAHSRGGLDYLRALGIRDLALAAGLSAASAGAPRVLALTAGLASLIPAGDIVLVARARPGSGPLALHSLSMLALLGVAAAAIRSQSCPRHPA